MLTGVARPVREPGVPVTDPVPPDPTTGVVDCCIPRFDGNPERLVIDSEGLVGVPVLPVTSNVLIGSVTGAQIGARLAQRMRPDYLRLLLAAIVLIVALRMALGLGWQPDEIYTVQFL